MRKMKLSESVVKYIFGIGAEPEVAVGEDGYVVYGFKGVYPAKLAVFLPIEIAGSNYSNFFPKSFDDYFRDLDLEISRLSLLLERGNVFHRFAKTEFVPGQVIRTEGEYTLFRFDEGLDMFEKDELLCRTPINGLMSSDLDRYYRMIDVDFLEYVEMLSGIEYLYWFLPVRRLFVHARDMPEDMTMVMESLCRQ